MKDSKSMEELADLFVQVVNRYNEMEKIPYFTGTDLILHRSEVHMIDAIGKNKDINITKLAKLQGITKAAVSKMIRNLVKKGLVTKSLSPETENEVVLNITDEGKKVFESHREYHERLNDEFTGIFSGMSEQALDELRSTLEKLGNAFDKSIEVKTSVQNEKSAIPK
jgi:DNA-binding MarR family transcriptional regulator